ncbi:MAG: DUF2608 domain-containing protein, partial [Holosporaceae bacterium]|nr:DUF2608 domain-containing protein [Holosporaceae bacterium]
MRNNNCIIEKYAAKAMVNSCYDKKLPSGRFYEGEVVEGALDCIKSYQNAGFSTVVITLGSFDIHSTRSEAMQNSGLNSCINLSEDKFEPSSISRKYPDGSLRFEWSLPDEKRIRAYYLGGHLYCAQFPNAQRAKSKGNTLRAFLETLKKNPTLIVAVDDKDYNILSIKEVCKKLKIPYLGFIIDLEENNANNIKKAAQEFSPEILTQIDSCIEVAQGRNHKNISIEGLPNVGLSTTTRKAEYIGMNTPAPTAAPKQTNLEKTLSAPTIANETEDDQDISISSLFSEEEFAPKVNNAGAPYGLSESSPQHNTSIAPAPFIELKQEYNREKNSQGMPKRMISPPSGYLSRIMPRANEKSPTPYMVKSSISPNSVKVKGKHRTFIIEDIEPSSSVPSMPPQTVTKGRFTIEEIGSSSSVPILPTQAVTKGRFTIKEIGSSSSVPILPPQTVTKGRFTIKDIGSSSSAPILPTQTVTKGRFTIEDIGGSSSSAPISPPPAVTKSRFIVEDIGSSSSAPVSPPPAVTKGRFIVEDIGSSSSAPVSPPQAVTKSRFIVEDIGSSSSAPVSPPPAVT